MEKALRTIEAARSVGELQGDRWTEGMARYWTQEAERLLGLAPAGSERDVALYRKRLDPT